MASFTTEDFALLGVGLGVIGLRTYARVSTVGISSLKADDYLMLVAAMLYAVESTLAYSVGAFWHGLANNAMTDEERRVLDPASEEFSLRVNGSKTQIAGWSTYTALLWMLKLCLCIFFLRLTDGLHRFQTRIRMGFLLIGVTWVAVFLCILLGCHPIEKNWQIYPDPGNACQPAISLIDILVMVVLNVVTDLYLLTIPLPMLWQSSIRPLKKAGLMVLFSGGLFVTMAGILRCVLIITDPINGAQQAGSWACRETFVAVVTSNLPMIFPLVRRWGFPLLSSFRSVTSHVTGGRSHAIRTDPQPGAFKLDERSSRRTPIPRTANPITNFTFSESEEHIYDLGNKTITRSGSPSDKSEETEVVRAGGIRKQLSVQVTESRKSQTEYAQGGATDVQTIGDYYLSQQIRVSSEAQLPVKPSGKRRPSFGFRRLSRKDSGR